MKVEIKLYQLILVLTVVILSVIALFKWSGHRHQLELDNASQALYRSERDVNQYEIIVDNLAEYASEQELLVVSKDRVIKAMEEETERLKALNIKHVRTIGELRLRIEVLAEGVPADTIVIYHDCHEDEGSYAKLPLTYKYDDHFVELNTMISTDGLSNMNFVIKPFDMNLTLGTKKESLFKRATEVSVVTTPNPYVDVEAMKFMVVDDNRKSPLYYYAVGAGSATGLVVILNFLLR
jgi:hypothetical protein